MIKKLKLAILLIFMLFISLQIYWRYNYGNIILVIQNQDLESEYTTKILINEETVQEYKFNTSNINPHELSFNKKFGKYKISVLRTDSQLREDVYITTILVKWIVISINDSDTIIIEERITPPFLQ